MKRGVQTKEGYLITLCEGCDACPVRDDGTEVRGKYNWLLTCAHCRGRRCLVCLPPDRKICNFCVKEAAA